MDGSLVKFEFEVGTAKGTLLTDSNYQKLLLHHSTQKHFFWQEKKQGVWILSNQTFLIYFSDVPVQLYCFLILPGVVAMERLAAPDVQKNNNNNNHIEGGIKYAVVQRLLSIFGCILKDLHNRLVFQLIFVNKL